MEAEYKSGVLNADVTILFEIGVDEEYWGCDSDGALPLGICRSSDLFSFKRQMPSE